LSGRWAARAPTPHIFDLNKDIRLAMAQPNVDKRLRDLGGLPRASTPEALTEKIAAQVKCWAGVIEAAGIQRQ
jgi:tripartite-type tricarboxylate transporter receptor subunit TctC